MKQGRFASGTDSIKANRRLFSALRKNGNGWHAFVEPLESRMLLSSSAATLATASPATSAPELVTPATTSGAVTLIGNVDLTTNTGYPIASGETSPTPQNSTDFGGTNPNGSAPVSVTYEIQNNATGTLTTTGTTPVTISGPGAAYFTVTTQPGASVAQGGFTTFVITFTPTKLGFEYATVNLATSDSAGPFTFEVRGEGTTTGETTVLGNSTFILSGDTTHNMNDFTDFGVTDADGSLPLTRQYTISNPLNAGTLTLIGSSPVTISGPGAADYSVTTQPGASVDGGFTTTFTITFTPKTAGSENATVSIANSDPAGTFSFGITGDGLTMTKVGTGGLLYDTTNPGDSRLGTAANNEILVMTYSGYLTNGTLFDSSDEHAPYYFEFELGVGQVIQGWDQGLVGALIGESRTLIIPPSLAYGSSARGSIPGNSTLIFNTVVLDVISAQALLPQGQLTATTGDEWVAVTDGQSNPSTTNGTSFGTVTSTPGTPLTQTFAITSPAGNLNALLGTPAISIQGSSAFTVSQLSINTADTGGTFTVTYTPTNNVSTAVVTANTSSPTGQNYTFAVQAEGPTSDDGTAQYVASTDDITGYAYNPLDPSQTDSVEVVISGGPPAQTILANEPSPELQSVLGTSSHDFTYAMPVLSVGTHTVSIYAIDTNTTTDAVSTTLLATTTVTSQNSLFDDHYYLATHPNVAAAVAAGTIATGYDHYLEYGQYEGYSPSPYWDESWYLQENPDVAAAVKAGKVSSGFMQYYLYGQYENRSGLLYFNTSYYLQNNPDVAAAVTAGTISSAFEHFVLYGQYEGRAPMLYFSSTVYLADNSDISAFVTGEPMTSDYEQFILYGQYEGRIASDFYNEQTYLADNPDVAAAVQAGEFPDGFIHWLEYGQYEGRTAV